MKVVMLMFDSLNRHLLPPYGSAKIHAPNFQRLAKRTATFEQSWVCSMPCMPARRDLLTGRPNFLHTDWAPLQPWDDCVPEIMATAGISSHLITDHYHYLEDGGFTYHNRYTTWQCFRGQEGDPWIGQVEPPEIPPNLNGKSRSQDWVNRQFLKEEKDFPQTQTMNAGLDFLERNHGADRWFLQIETFDPHEPFNAAKEYQSLYPHAGETPIFDWPAYDDVKESPEEIQRVQQNYAALVSQCDANLGRLLDAMDRHQLWDDTMLIVWTDHGYLLGEHGRWAKNIPTMWNEIARTPFFMWDPRHPDCAGQRRTALVQPSIDLGPTLLGFFGLESTADMTGRDLSPVLANDTPVRNDAIFGYFNLPIHYTDGRYVYMRDVVDRDQPIHIYNSMPVHFRGRWKKDDWENAELVEPLPFTKGIPVLRRPCRKPWTGENGNHRLFDLQADPAQEQVIKDSEIESKIVRRLRDLTRECHAPAEMLQRYGLW